MEITKAFLIETLNTVKNNITVVDSDFNIVFTNKAWNDFGKDNGCLSSLNWQGINYYTPCLLSALDGDEFCIKAVKQFDMLKNGLISEFQLEYPCHSPSEDRWFNMEVTPLLLNNQKFYVISHQNITTRVALEQQAIELSQIDGLTSISNRRAFNDFIDLEWHHCLRNKFQLSFAMIDVDNFKQINDQYGHQVGDACLQDIAAILTEVTNRASDKCARYGGDEFVVVWGQSEHHKALKLSNEILNKINKLNLTGLDDKILGKVSTSIGLCTATPNMISLKDFIDTADKLMYSAKKTGKNTIIDKLITSDSSVNTSAKYSHL